MLFFLLFEGGGAPPGWMGPKAEVPRPRINKNKMQHAALEPGPAPQLGHFCFNSPWGYSS